MNSFYLKLHFLYVHQNGPTKLNYLVTELAATAADIKQSISMNVWQ